MPRPIEASPPIEGESAAQLERQLATPIDLARLRDQARKARARLREVLGHDDESAVK